MDISDSRVAFATENPIGKCYSYSPLCGKSSSLCLFIQSIQGDSPRSHIWSTWSKLLNFPTARPRVKFILVSPAIFPRKRVFGFSIEFTLFLMTPPILLYSPAPRPNQLYQRVEQQPGLVFGQQQKLNGL